MSSPDNPQPISFPNSAVADLKRLMQSMTEEERQDFLRWVFQTYPRAWVTFTQVFVLRGFPPLQGQDLNRQRIRTSLMIAYRACRAANFPWPPKIEVRETDERQDVRRDVRSWTVVGQAVDARPILRRLRQAQHAPAAPELPAAAQGAAAHASQTEALEALVLGPEMYGRCSMCTEYVTDRNDETQYIGKCCPNWPLICSRCKASDRSARQNELSKRWNAKNPKPREHDTASLRAGKLGTRVTCLHGCSNSDGSRRTLETIPTSVCSQLRDARLGQKKVTVVHCDFCPEWSHKCLAVYPGLHCFCGRVAWICKGCWEKRQFTLEMVRTQGIIVPCPDPICSNAARWIVNIQTLSQVLASTLPQTLEDARNDNAEMRQFEQTNAGLAEQARQRMAEQVQQVREQNDRAEFLEALNNPEQLEQFFDAQQQMWLRRVNVDRKGEVIMILPSTDDGSQVAAGTTVKQEEIREVGGVGGVGGSAQR